MKITWDQIGISLSGLCVIHCLVFPLIVALLPLWPVTEAIHIWTHPILFLLIVPTVILALRKSRGDRAVLLLLCSGVALVGAAWLLHELELVTHTGDVVITTAGSFLLVAGHLKNYKTHSHQ